MQTIDTVYILAATRQRQCSRYRVYVRSSSPFGFWDDRSEQATRAAPPAAPTCGGGDRKIVFAGSRSSLSIHTAATASERHKPNNARTPEQCKKVPSLLWLPNRVHRSRSRTSFRRQRGHRLLQYRSSVIRLRLSCLPILALHLDLLNRPSAEASILRCLAISVSRLAYASIMLGTHRPISDLLLRVELQSCKRVDYAPSCATFWSHP